MYLFSVSLNKVVQFASGNETLTYLQAVQVNGGDDCPEYAMDGLLKGTITPSICVNFIVFIHIVTKHPFMHRILA